MEIPMKYTNFLWLFSCRNTYYLPFYFFRIHQFFQMQSQKLVARTPLSLRFQTFGSEVPPKRRMPLVAGCCISNGKYPHPKDERVLPLKRGKGNFIFQPLTFGGYVSFRRCTLERENHRLKGRKRDMSGQFPSSYPPKITINHIRGIISHIKRGKRCFSHDRKPLSHDPTRVIKKT